MGTSFSESWVSAAKEFQIISQLLAIEFSNHIRIFSSSLYATSFPITSEMLACRRDEARTCTCSHFFLLLSLTCVPFHLNECTISVSWTELAKAETAFKTKTTAWTSRAASERCRRWEEEWRGLRWNACEGFVWQKREKAGRRGLCDEANYEAEMMREKISF